MAPSEMNCTACDASFDARAFCPDCGAPTALAPEEQRILWEMGQWDEAAAPEQRSISLSRTKASVPTASAASASGDGARAGTTDKKKPFSPVPLPKKTGSIPRRERAATPPAARRGPTQPPAAQRHLMSVTDGASALAPQPIEEAEVEPANEVEPAAEVTPTIDATPTTEQAPAAAQEASAPAAEVTEERSATKSAPAVDRGTAPEPAPPPAKPKRQVRKQHKLLERMGLLAGEDAAFMLDGTVGFNPASFVLTNYRVAVIPHSSRLPIRWIPLEEVAKVNCRRGSSVVTIDASVEFLRFGTRRAHKLHEAVDALTEYVKEARSGRTGSRHNAELVQLWCDRTGEIWDSNLGRLRLWVAHHPKAKLAWALPFLPAVYVAVINLR